MPKAKEKTAKTAKETQNQEPECLDVLPPALIEKTAEKFSLTMDQVELCKRTVAEDCTDDEFALFLYTAQRTGLDPLARQIHAVKRGQRMTVQVGIDGFRAIAERTGNYAGNDDPVFNDNDNGHPVCATVTVYKIVKGMRCPFSATARWDEYFPGEKQGFMWRKMPHVMLGKCAEALALRKAFPAVLSGVYAPEEMDQATGKAINIREITQESIPQKDALPTMEEMGDALEDSMKKKPDAKSKKKIKIKL